MRWGLVVLSSAGLCSFTPMFHWHCEKRVEGLTHKNGQTADGQERDEMTMTQS